jgi:hypothetical protein
LTKELSLQVLSATVPISSPQHVFTRMRMIYSEGELTSNRNIVSVMRTHWELWLQWHNWMVIVGVSSETLSSKLCSIHGQELPRCIAQVLFLQQFRVSYTCHWVLNTLPQGHYLITCMAPQPSSRWRTLNSGIGEEVRKEMLQF